MPTVHALSIVPEPIVAASVCAWCGSAIDDDRRARSADTSYGICDPCLDVRMDRLSKRAAPKGGARGTRDRLRASCPEELSANPS